MVHTFTLGSETLKSYKKLSEATARAVARVYTYMRKHNLNQIFEADLVNAIGKTFSNGSKAAQYQLLERAIGGGVEVRGVVLRIEKTGEQKKLYDKTKLVTMRAGALLAEVGPAESDSGEDEAFDESAAEDDPFAETSDDETPNHAAEALARELQANIIARTNETRSKKIVMTFARKAREESDPAHLRAAGLASYEHSQEAAKARLDLMEVLPASMRAVMEDVFCAMMEEAIAALMATIDSYIALSVKEDTDKLMRTAREDAQHLAKTFDERLNATMARVEANSQVYADLADAGRTRLDQTGILLNRILHRLDVVENRIALEIGAE